MQNGGKGNVASSLTRKHAKPWVSQDKVFAERTSALCCRMSLHVVLWLTLLPNDVSVSGEVALALAQSKARTWRAAREIHCYAKTRTKRDAPWRCEFMNLSPIASNCPDQLCWCMPSQSKQSQECWHTNLHAYGCAWSPYWFEGRSMFLSAIAVILRIRIRNLSHFIDIRNYVPLLSAW